MDSWFFIVNPIAGGGKKYKKWLTLEAALNKSKLSYAYQVTQSKAHVAGIINAAIRDGYTHFVVVGGDGSINDVVNALFKESPVDICTYFLAVLPWGTGNDFAAYYQLPSKTSAFVTMLQTKKVRRHDVGQATYAIANETQQHYFVNFLGVGFDSYTLEKMGAAGGSRLRYLRYVLKCLRTYRSPQFYAFIHNEKIPLRSLMLLVCIGRFGGAGMKFAPQAQASDGLFNVLSIGDMPFLRRFMSLIVLFNGKINQHSNVQTWITDALSIQADTTLAFQSDGEVIAGLPVNIRCLPQALQVVVP